MSTEAQVASWQELDMAGQKERVLAFIQKRWVLWSTGTTPDEAEHTLQMDRKSTSRCFSHLRDDGKIMETSERRASGLAGRKAQTVMIPGDDRHVFRAKQLASVTRQATRLGYRLVKNDVSPGGAGQL